MTSPLAHLAWLRTASLAAAVVQLISVAAPSAAQSVDVALRISPESAVTMALENNLGLEGDRRGPEMAALAVRAAERIWAPTVVATAGLGRTESPAGNAFDRTLGTLDDRYASSEVSLRQQLPWGTSYDVGWTNLRRSNTSSLNRFQPELSATATAGITQPLLRGFSIDAARAERARRVQAGDRAAFELAGATTALKRDVLYSYWQWVHARDVRIVAVEALALAQVLLDGNRERVAARAMAATDVIEAEAEVARRDESVIVAEKNVANAEDRLRLLILNPASPEYSRPFEPLDSTPLQSVGVSIDPIARALAERSDLRTSRSRVDTSRLDVRYLRDEARPDVNLIAAFSATALGGTELGSIGGTGAPIADARDRGFGLVLSDLGQLRYPGWSTQVTVVYPVGAAVAKVNAARALVEMRQNELRVAALEQRVTTEVRTAQREVATNDKRLRSTVTAVTLAERRLAAEEEKFLVGLSTSFFVFQAQRDLAGARIARLGALLDHRRSLVDLESIQSAPNP